MIHLRHSYPALVAALVISMLAATVVPQRRESGPAGPRSENQARPGDFNQVLIKGNTAFALELYGKLRRHDGNIFFSPYSISSALSMTCLGARGETAKQMVSVLRLPADPGDTTRGFGALNKSLNGNGENRAFQLDVANALWGAKGTGFLEAFVKAIREGYGAGLKELDFRNDTEGSRRSINDWVEQATHEKIKDLLPPGSIQGNTGLVLTNAIYFKSAWSLPFDEHSTSQGDFFLPKRQKITAPLMANTGSGLGYWEDADLQALELRYLGDLSMLILLPRQTDGLPLLEKSLTDTRLSDIQSKIYPTRVHVVLPKFKITSSFTLNETLRTLGMELPFTDRADFSGMDGKRDLLISLVAHKAYVDVNEKGTEAAAATAVVGALMSRVSLPPKEFRADHPFLFVITHRPSGTILFMGRLQNPAP